MTARLLTIGLLLVAACSKSDGKNPVSAAPAGPRIGPVVFSSLRDGNAEIYVLNPDSTNPARMTNNSGAEGEPAWSPDGTRIAFVSDRDGDPEIYVMNSDSTNQTRLTINPGPDGHPAWSPDGTKIAFVSERDGNAEIYVMNADGTDTTNVTRNPAPDQWPTWSPDGSKIAFESTRDYSTDIYVINADGSNQSQVTSARWWAAHPAPSTIIWSARSPDWSPDGSKIAFVAWDGSMAGIQVMGANGGQHSFLRQDWQYEVAPSWSRDGKQIAFASNRDGKMELYVMDANGSHVVRLTNNSSADETPDCGPKK